ncbi:MAG: hypothetical protein Fur0039_03930 [Rhodocyclaceae bacterium]
MSAFLDLPARRSARGEVDLPGSKSISNRCLLLAALASGATEIRSVLRADDVDRMLEALSALGIECERLEPAGDCRVQGAGGAIPVREADLFLGNAGTALRPLTAVLALSGGHYRLSGVARMHERPIGDLVDALERVGARIRYLGREGFPPLEILPARIRMPDAIPVSGAISSQFLTALLIAAPLAGRAATIEVRGELVSRPYIEITLGLMARFGVEVGREDWRRFRIPAGASYRSPGVLRVEGDATAASYFLAAGAIGGGPVRVRGVGRDSLQGDVRFADALAAMGARVDLGEDWIEAREPAGGRLRAFDLDLNAIPDAAMTLAILALFAEGESRLRNIGNWRVKETDRLHAMAVELRKLGATVEEGADSLSVTPPRDGRLTAGAAIETYDDHRMAMCFSLACLAGVPVRILDPACVAKTFPDYFRRFAAILHS